MKEKLEKVWRTLTPPERVALVVLMDVLTNRSNVIKKDSPSITSVGMINDRFLGENDSTMLRQEAQDYLENFLEENVIQRFDELYRKLVTKI